MNKTYLYKYRTFGHSDDEKEVTRRIFTRHQLYFAAPEKFNDLFECRISISVDDLAQELKKTDGLIWDEENVIKTPINSTPDILNELRTQVGVLSLTECSDSLLMWAHYADSHSGICLEFCADRDSPLFSEARPVKYVTDFPTIDIFHSTFAFRAQTALLHKATEWSYEREWRILDTTTGSGLR